MLQDKDAQNQKKPSKNRALELHVHADEQGQNTDKPAIAFIEVCPSCNGNKVFHRFDGYWEMCPRCKGKGQIPAETTLFTSAPARR